MESFVEESIEDLELYINTIYNNMSNRRDSKRGRAQLRSSEQDDSSNLEDLLRIRESMTTMEKQLKKLDLLKKLSDNIEDLKQAMDFNNSLIEVLRQDNTSLRVEVNNLKELQKNDKMSNDILEMQCRSMRENLKMDEREVEAIHFSRAHRIGHANASRQKSRPIVAKVHDTKMKMSIMRRGKELRDTNFSISD
ncbi:uncharacterized protein LOC119127540, partial [Scomber scombrus]